MQKADWIKLPVETIVTLESSKPGSTMKYLIMSYNCVLFSHKEDMSGCSGSSWWCEISGGCP